MSSTCAAIRRSRTDDIPVILKMWEDVGIKTKLTPTADDVFVPIFYESKGPKGGPDEGPSYDVFFTYGFGTLDGSPWVPTRTGTGRGLSERVELNAVQQP